MNAPTMQGLPLTPPAFVKHARLVAWVADMVALLEPDAVYWCDGSDQEYNALCQKLVDVGCQAVMPWAAPIGTGKGPINPYAMKTLRERLQVPLIVDAGLGLPSHACQVMEWGYDAVLLNTAVALARDPVAMAAAFAQAVRAGRTAHLAGAMQEQEQAQPSTPVLGTPFWHQS